MKIMTWVAVLTAITAVCCLGSPPAQRPARGDASGSQSGSSRFHFEDITGSSGLGAFNHVSGDPRQKRYIMEVMSGGVAIFDYDNDGKPDVYLVNGSTLDVLRGKTQPDPGMKSRLYHNLCRGKFVDVTEQAGV